jgi:hypothetical protein
VFVTLGLLGAAIVVLKNTVKVNLVRDRILKSAELINPIIIMLNEGELIQVQAFVCKLYVQYHTVNTVIVPTYCNGNTVIVIRPLSGMMPVLCVL